MAGRPKKQLKTPDEMADFLHVSRGTIFGLLREGCPHVRVGSLPRFDEVKVMRWLEHRTLLDQQAM